MHNTIQIELRLSSYQWRLYQSWGESELKLNGEPSPPPLDYEFQPPPHPRNQYKNFMTQISKGK